MRRLLLPLAITGLLVAPLAGHGQGSEVYGPGLRLKPNPEKDAFIRFIFWNQLWARSVQNSPGTLVNGVAADNTMDVGIRRSRFLAFAQINPRYRVLFHAGINNQTFSTGGVPNGGVTGNGGTYTSGKKPGIFIHDAWNEYDIVPAGKREDGTDKPFSLTAGVGLHYFNGVSRMSSASTLNFLAIDAPIFNWYNIEVGDQFARQFGFFLKGKAGRLDYRVHVNKPFATNTVATPALEPIAVDNNGVSKAAYGGYFMYQFLEKESNVLPFTVGSYLGTKKVFNIGAGFYNQAEGTVTSRLVNDGADTTLTKHDINLFGVDVFADIPFGGEKNMAVTAYSVYYMHDWGPNYYRSVGIMNVGTNDTGVWRGTAYVPDLRALLANFIPADRANRALDLFARRNGISITATGTADARLVTYVERVLSGIIGAASARIMVSSVVKEEELGMDEVLNILRGSQQLIVLNKELRQHGEELDRLTQELQRVNEDLRKSDALKDEFLYTVTHELRTPLTSIRALSEILHDNPALGEDERQHFLGTMVRETERLSRLIEQVLDLEKFESGKQSLDLAEVDLPAVIDEALDTLQQLLREKGITLHIAVDRSLPTVIGDRDRLLQVLINLLSNAIKFCAPDSGRIEVSAVMRPGSVRVEVADNGPGVEPALRELIFEKFFQERKKAAHAPVGTGLGLAISKKIMELHNGDIGVESDDRAGARFHFTLPLQHLDTPPPTP